MGGLIALPIDPSTRLHWVVRRVATALPIGLGLAHRVRSVDRVSQ